MSYDFETEKYRIQQELISRGLSNTALEYEEFLRLYEPYKSVMPEKDFALVLGIKYVNFSGLKNGKHRVKIFKDETEKYATTNKRELEIRDLIANNIRPGSSINYSEFLELYEPYKKEFSIAEFAKIIGITVANVNNMKNRGRKAKILKFMHKDISPKRKELIREEIRTRIPNRAIEYTEFKELYKLYEEEMNEEEFADVLGITYNSYMHLKNGAERASIKYNLLTNTRIEYEFSEANYYSMKQLDKIAEKYGVTIEYILETIFNKNDYYINQLKMTLEERGKIFIGQKQVTEEFMQEHSEYLINLCHEYSKALGINLNTSRYSEDIAQEVFLKTMQTKGDVVENLSSEQARKTIKRYMKVSIKFKHIDHLKVKKQVSLDKKYSVSDRRTMHDKIESRDNTKEQYEANSDSINEEETPISLIQNCFINGMSRTQVLNYVMEEFGLSKKELIKILEEEITKTKSIKIGADGKKYLAERE